MLRRTPLLALLLSLTLAPAASAITIKKSDVTRTVHCHAGDRTVRVLGAEAHLTITGRCTSVHVSGSEAKIKAGTVDRITIDGAESHLTYRRSSAGGRAKVTVTGQGSTVRRRP